MLVCNKGKSWNKNSSFHFAFGPFMGFLYLPVILKKFLKGAPCNRALIAPAASLSSLRTLADKKVLVKK